jgi:hypothetical protein
MQLRILRSAFGDLDQGRAFYAQHGEALGDYFLDSLFTDIDSLVLYAGNHVQVWGISSDAFATVSLRDLLQVRRRRLHDMARLGLS